MFERLNEWIRARIVCQGIVKRAPGGFFSLFGELFKILGGCRGICRILHAQACPGETKVTFAKSFNVTLLVLQRSSEFLRRCV